MYKVWTGPQEDEIDNFGTLSHVVPSERWPYGPPEDHDDCCGLHSGVLFCDCGASSEDDEA
jgi:hypothetical protein